MSAPVIEVNGLSKCYQLGMINRHTLVEEMQHLLLKLRGKNPAQHMGKVGAGPQPEGKAFWALKDVSFKVEAGEVLGIIGGNGAGKSTLLKVLSRITEPTRGEALIRGRVGSLLEVGTGFHPELSGRENVFMNGTLLGMQKREVTAKFDEIVAFSGVEKFIDTPVKRYSSGMYVRLAFAVAAHLEPEVLIVDEVLAVGDAEFQKKCLGKMGDVAKAGRTVLFVSHQMPAVSDLCNRCVWMKEGQVQAIGPAPDIVEAYLSEKNNISEGVYEASSEEIRDRQTCIHRVQILSAENEPTRQFDFSEAFSVAVDFSLEPRLPHLHLCISLLDLQDQRLCTNEISCEDLHPGQSRHQVRVHYPAEVLMPGSYKLMLALHVHDKKIHDLVPSCCKFHVTDVQGQLARYHGQKVGSFVMKTQWEAHALPAL